MQAKKPAIKPNKAVNIFGKLARNISIKTTLSPLILILNILANIIPNEIWNNIDKKIKYFFTNFTT